MLAKNLPDPRDMRLYDVKGSLGVINFRLLELVRLIQVRLIHGPYMAVRGGEGGLHHAVHAAVRPDLVRPCTDACMGQRCGVGSARALQVWQPDLCGWPAGAALVAACTRARVCGACGGGVVQSGSMHEVTPGLQGGRQCSATGGATALRQQRMTAACCACCGGMHACRCCATARRWSSLTSPSHACWLLRWAGDPWA